ncbi:hypothetical protein P7C71_g1996, partial [Lecanoromycetidae sp. Uapishka_2]
MERTLYAFSDPDLATDNLRPLTLRQMASRYAATISNLDSPSVILCGWSFGGVLAFETAHILQASGFNVKGLILIDSPYPQDHQPLPEKIIRYVLSKRSPKVGVQDNSDEDRMSSALLAEFTANAALLKTYSPSMLPKYVKTVSLSSRDTMDTQTLCGVSYDWLSNSKARTEAIKGWGKIIGGEVDVIEIPGNHFEAFDEKNIVELSAQMKKACQIIENST